MQRDFQFLPTLLIPEVQNRKKPYKMRCEEYGHSPMAVLYYNLIINNLHAAYM